MNEPSVFCARRYVDSNTASTVETEDSPQNAKTSIAAAVQSSSLSQPTVPFTTTPVDVTETENPIVTTTAKPMVTTEVEDEDVVTVLAVAATALDGSGGGGSGPSFSTRLPYTTNEDGRTQLLLTTDTVPPEYYDDQPEEPATPVPEPSSPDCSAPNAYRFYTACAALRQQQLQQQQLQQIQQQQLLLQQHQHQQQIYQQQQQFYQQQQLQEQHQQQQQFNHVATALVKRPTPGGGGMQVRFPGDKVDPASMAADSANLIRFPGPAPYRTTNKMYESSRHPTWWPTGWPEQEQQQQSDDSVQQQHQLQHHLPQQKQDVRLWEFGSRLPKTTTTTVVPPSVQPPTQWFHRFF